MNDDLGKKSWRSLLVEHNKAIGPTMSIPNQYYCQYGTMPRCRQSIPSVDLFNLLEPLTKQFGFYEVDLNIFFNQFDPRFSYTTYDLSFTVGQGQCVPAWFKLVGVGNFEELYGIPAVDCSNIHYALKFNPAEVLSVMKHSIQPAGQFKSAEQLFDNFPARRVVRALESSAKNKLIGALGEHIGPRIMHCADSMKGTICNSVKSVLSSEGTSVGFNARNQSKVMLNSTENALYFQNFLSHPIVM